MRRYSLGHIIPSDLYSLVLEEEGRKGLKHIMLDSSNRIHQYEGRSWFIETLGTFTLGNSEDPKEYVKEYCQQYAKKGDGFLLQQLDLNYWTHPTWFASDLQRHIDLGRLSYQSIKPIFLQLCKRNSDSISMQALHRKFVMELDRRNHPVQDGKFFDAIKTEEEWENFWNHSHDATKMSDLHKCPHWQYGTLNLWKQEYRRKNKIVVDNRTSVDGRLPMRLRAA